ncbi:MAG: rod shape-determining protein RodA [Candidatus Pacebacteria bacterium]|nr:rod shape-determining protein RodA [Candidatus Paceibacterota bacterium]
MNVLKRIDWQLMMAVALLCGAGLVSLLSSHQDLFWKQCAWCGVGLVVALILTLVDLRSFFSHRGFVLSFYYVTVGLLALTYFFAPAVKGNRAWLFIGPFQFQPAELAKVALILVLARYLAKCHVSIGRWRTIAMSLLWCVPLVGFIAVQPDMGSALMLLIIWGCLVLMSGLPLKRVAIGALAAILIGGLLWGFVLKGYQKERIIGAFNPERDPLGVNYNIIQSKIAIGSGGWFGKGFGQGTQTQLGFLPEGHNDFIFSAIAEEGGFFAILVLIIAYVWMMVRILKMGARSDNNMYAFVCLGTAALFFGQFFFNVGSATGLLPVIGVTLPFVSYGGSSILANMILIGMIQSFWARK